MSVFFKENGGDVFYKMSVFFKENGGDVFYKWVYFLRKMAEFSADLYAKHPAERASYVEYYWSVREDTQFLFFYLVVGRFVGVGEVKLPQPQNIKVNSGRKKNKV